MGSHTWLVCMVSNMKCLICGCIYSCISMWYNSAVLKWTPWSFVYLVHWIAWHMGTRLSLKETAPKALLQICIKHAPAPSEDIRLWTYDPSIRELQNTCLGMIRWHSTGNQMNSSSRCSLCKRQKGKKQPRLSNHVRQIKSTAMVQITVFPGDICSVSVLLTDWFPLSLRHLKTKNKLGI